MKIEPACEQCQRDLAAFDAGWLPGARTREVEAHLDACAACRSWRERDHELVSALGTMEEAAPPPVTWAQVQAARQRPRLALMPIRPARRFAVAGLAAALVVGAIGVQRVRPPVPAGPGAAVAPVPVAAASEDRSFVLAHGFVSGGDLPGDPNRLVMMEQAAAADQRVR